MSHYPEAQTQAFGSLAEAVKNHLADAIKTFFVLDPLRSGRGHEGVPFDFTFLENDDKTKIFVATEYPDVEREIPSVLVTRCDLTTDEADLGQALGPRDSINMGGQLVGKGGLLRGRVYVAIEAAKEDERNLLTDILTIGFTDRLKLRRLLAIKGIHMVQPFVTPTGESTRPLTNIRRAFTQVLQLNVLSMWKTYRPLEGAVIEDVVKAILPVDRHLSGDIFGS